VGEWAREGPAAQFFVQEGPRGGRQGREGVKSGEQKKEDGDSSYAYEGIRNAVEKNDGSKNEVKTRSWVGFNTKRG